MGAASWVYEEARKLVERTKNYPIDRPVVFETGYGPSNRCHIGTLTECVRTTMVRRAFERLSGRPTILYVVSDDLDGLRKTPKNFSPEQAAILDANHGRPLSSVPNVYGDDASSYAESNNADFRAKLSQFGLENGRDYTFLSATEAYTSGLYNDTLRLVTDNIDKINDVILPTLGKVNAGRQDTYFPFLPIVNGKVHHEIRNPHLTKDGDDRLLTFIGEDGNEHRVSVLNGGAKLQWKVDWAARWISLGINFEMHGKDLIDSATLGSKICRALGYEPPQLMRYELFLDEDGHKVSKSVGNGFSVESWLRYAPQEAVWYYMHQNPSQAKKLHFDVVPQTVDSYLTELRVVNRRDALDAEPVEDVIGLIHPITKPDANFNITFGILLNLVEVANSRDPNVLWGFLQRHCPVEQDNPLMGSLVRCAIHYYEDRVEPFKKFKEPTEIDRQTLSALADVIDSLPEGSSADEVQFHVYEIGKKFFGKERLKDFFQMCYEVLFGKTSGPRLGVFIAIYGLKESVTFIREKI